MVSGFVDIKRFLDTTNSVQDWFREYLRGVLSGFAIDEVAVLAPNEGLAMGFITNAVREPGVELFNAANDRVRTGPIKSLYNVAYWFLKTPYSYRIEVMSVSGFSPLHQAVLQEDPVWGSLLPVHASFKCNDEAEYADAVIALRKDEWEIIQRCDSTYGKFSYWSHPTKSPAGWYLKPRVNLRDAK